MIYSLQCGNCGVTSYVESDILAMEWKCVSCGELSTTSVPNDENGEPLKTVGHGSIVGEKAEDVDGEVVKSDPVDTYEKSKPVEPVEEVK